jgi:hypothetical protein
LILAYQGLGEENLDQKSPGPPSWRVSAAGQLPTHRKKKFAKKPIGNTLDRCNPRRHKLRKRTTRLGTLNVQGIRNKTGEIIKVLEELKQDITKVIVSRTNKSDDTK